MRNKTTITTLILDAAIILAVSLFMFVIRPWDKADKVEADYTPAPELSIAEQEDESPLFNYLEGSSRPVDVEPVEGIRITAPANALDKDREFKITAVDEKTWEEAEKKLAEVSPEQMLFCFDLDAGLAPEEILPGEYTVSFDLEKIGIPSVLHDKITVWRESGADLYKYTSWVKNGKLYYRSSQNSLTFVCLVGLAVGGAYLYETSEKRKMQKDLYDGWFSQKEDVVEYPVKDEYGDFTLYFRYQKTEYADRFEAFKTSVQDYENRLKELEKKADDEVKRRTKEAYEKETEFMNSFQLLFKSKTIENRCRRAINRAAMLENLKNDDQLLKQYQENQALPPSVLDIEKQLKIANRYLTDDQGCRPQTKNLQVYLVGTDQAGGASGEYKHTATKRSYVVVDYEKMLANRAVYQREGRGEGMLITLTHELFHHRQKISKWIDFRTEETMAAYMENDAALYYIMKGEIVTKDVPSIIRNVKALFSGVYVGGKDFDATDRDRYEVFGRSFNLNTLRRPDWAYTYADFMDFLQRKMNLKRAIKAGVLINQYSYTASYADNYKTWFGLGNEFTEYLEEFCVRNLNLIRTKESQSDVKLDNPDIACQDYTLTSDKPILRVDPLNLLSKNEVQAGDLLNLMDPDWELTMRTFDLGSGMGNRRKPFNAFIINADFSSYNATFYTSSDLFVNEIVKGNYFSGDKTEYSGAIFSKGGLKPSYTIVALFAPDKPVIKKVKKNYISFKVPEPDRELVKNQYVTGVLYTYRNSAGDERTILAPAKKFGKQVKWNLEGAGESAFTLTAKWISQQVQGMTYESPESEPFVHGSVPSDVTASANVASDKKVDKKKAKEDKKAEEKVVKHDSQDRLVEDKRYIDNPFEKIEIYNVWLPEGVTPECKVPINITERVANAMDLNAPNGLGKPSTYLTYKWKFTEENSEIKIASRGEGYLLSIKSTQTKSFSNKSWSTWLRGSPDQTYDFNIELIFNEDLGLISGKVSQNTVFYMEIEPSYEEVTEEKGGTKKFRWKNDGQGIRWEKCTYEASYSFTCNNKGVVLSRWEGVIESRWDGVIHDYNMKAITKEHELHSPNVATFEWSAGKEDLKNDSTVQIILGKKE